MHFTQTELMG